MKHKTINRVMEVVCADCLKNQPYHYEDSTGSQFLFCPHRGVLVILHGQNVWGWEGVTDAIFFSIIRQAKDQTQAGLN